MDPQKRGGKMLVLHFQRTVAHPRTIAPKNPNQKVKVDWKRGGGVLGSTLTNYSERRQCRIVKRKKIVGGGTGLWALNVEKAAEWKETRNTPSAVRFGERGKAKIGSDKRKKKKT